MLSGDIPGREERRNGGMNEGRKEGKTGGDETLIHCAIATEASADHARTSGPPCSLSPSMEAKGFPFFQQEVAGDGPRGCVCVAGEGVVITSDQQTHSPQCPSNTDMCFLHAHSGQTII